MDMSNWLGVKSIFQGKWIAALALYTLSAATFAAPIFFVNSGPDPANDNPWQAAAGPFAETDFEFAPNGPLAPFSLGGVTVTSSLPTAGSSPFAIFSTFNPTGGPGTIAGVRLLSCNTDTCLPGELDQQVTFSFSQPVFGAGIWIFDDGTSGSNSFKMTANGMDSGVLDAVPGSFAHTVEGFLGVIDPNGLTSFTISSVEMSGVYGLDHLQIATSLPQATAPEPASLLLVLVGLIGLGFMRTQKRSWAHTMRA